MEERTCGDEELRDHLYDPDGGNGLGNAHWVAYNIPAFKTSLAEGEASQSPKEWTGGKNSIGKNNYFGPCGPAVVSFVDDGSVLVSPNLSGVARKVLGAEHVSPLKGLRNGHQKNLAAHRARHGF